MESKHVPLLSCSSHICSLRVPAWRSPWTRVYAVGTQRRQRRHRNVGPSRGLGPVHVWLEGWCWSRKVEKPSEMELWEGSEAVLRGADLQTWRGTFSPGRAWTPSRVNVRGLCWFGAALLTIIPLFATCQPATFVSRACQHILNAEIAGEASPGKTTWVRQLLSFSPDRAKTSKSTSL